MKAFSLAVRAVTFAVMVSLAGQVAAQQGYPNKPIRIITPYAPGGSTSVLARLVGQKLTDSWGQQVLVESRGGGNTIIGSDAAAKSAPDGYTLLVAGSTLVINASLYAKLPFDCFKDLAPIGALTSLEYLLAAHPSVPANNLQELIALAKSKPGQLNYASTGTTMQLASELFNIMAGTKLQHVPYKGGGQAVTDIIGGQVQLMFAIPSNVIAHVKSGRLKGIAVSGKNRLPAAPQVPTFSEAGLQGYDVTSWYGLFAPAGTPKEIIDKLAAETAKMLAQDEFKEKMESQGFEAYTSTPEGLASLLKSDYAKYAKIIKAANVKLEE